MDDRADIPFKQRLTCTIRQTEVATGLGRTKINELIDEKKIDIVHVGSRVLIVVPSLLKLFGLNDDPPATVADLHQRRGLPSDDSRTADALPKSQKKTA
jgi:hypothetical protein